MMMHCEHCGEQMLHVFCEECDGRGYWWRPDGFDGWRAIPCGHCEETGKCWHCANRDCPGVVWYPLSARDQGLLRTAQQGVMEDGQR